MKKGLTELVFVLDKSGSMSGLEKDTIGGYNAMLEKQKKLKGECFITTVLFSTYAELLHDRIDIRAVKEITEKEYAVGGMTALIDAIGMSINKIETAQKNTADDYKAEKVMFVIITDGEENASRKYQPNQVKAMIEKKKECGWEFIFLGSNIDAVRTASDIGIGADRAVDYVPDGEGTSLNFNVMSKAVESFRNCGVLNNAPFEAIHEDMKKRGKKQ